MLSCPCRKRTSHLHGSNLACQQVLPNTDLPTLGGELGNAITADAAGCCAKCEGTTGCKAWTYITPQYTVNPAAANTCLLRGGMGVGVAPQVSAPGLTSGFVTPPTCQSFANLDLPAPGYELANLNGVTNLTDTPDLCCAQCKATAGCKAWSWVGAGALSPMVPKSCWLKSVLPEGVPNANVTSGYVSGNQAILLGTPIASVNGICLTSTTAPLSLQVGPTNQATWFAFSFTTAAPCEIGTISFMLKWESAATVPSVQLRNDDGTGKPGSNVLLQFTNPAPIDYTNFQLYPFTAPTKKYLDGMTRYWVYVSATGGSLSLGNTSATPATPTGIATYDDAIYQATNGVLASWKPITFQIEALLSA